MLNSFLHIFSLNRKKSESEPEKKVVQKTIVEEGCDNGHEYEEDKIKSHIIYFENTTQKNVEYVTVFGKLHGEYNLYDRSGNLMSYSLYKNGLLHGDCIEYDGVSKYIRTYENGKEVSQKKISYTDTGGRIFDS